MSTESSPQMSLFGAIQQVYAERGAIPNSALYDELIRVGVLTQAEISRREQIGGGMHSPAMRKIRWHQQTLKKLGILERVEGSRGLWRAKSTPSGDLTPTPAGVALVAFSTRLGVAIWGDNRVLANLDEPIHLCLTSPPYCLSRPRAYGNPSQAEYVDFVCEGLEPIVKNLAPGGSICLNISNDIFDKGSPARSLIRERLVIALHDRLGLHKLDELIWHNPSKAPGPIAWASKQRFQLNTAWEPIYWFTNDPARLRSDNRRVLEPHTEEHQKLIDQGGEQRKAVFADGANRIRPGSFGNKTLGRIPRNVITSGHRCAKQTPAREAAKSAGIPVHGAAMPYRVAELLIKLTTKEGDLVVDNHGGIQSTAEAAERNNRRWITTDIHHEYVWAGAHRFTDCDDFELSLSL